MIFTPANKRGAGAFDARQRERDRKFADSPLEGGGFELPVPGLNRAFLYRPGVTAPFRRARGKRQAPSGKPLENSDDRRSQSPRDRLTWVDNGRLNCRASCVSRGRSPNRIGFVHPLAGAATAASIRPGSP